MSKIALLAIDQGTTSSRTIAFDTQGGIIVTAQQELALYTPQAGWVEQNSEDIWVDTLATVRDAYAGAVERGYSVAGIGITNQRETTIVWDRETGQAVYNAIVWQDRRTAQRCAELKAAGYEEMIADKTGLLLDPYFSATKLAWILGTVEGARERAEAGALLFGTVDSFVLWHLTGGTNGGVHATDATNASRTMLYNIRTQAWDDELLELFNIPRGMLPDVWDTVADFGHTAEGILPYSFCIGAMVGDQQGALAGQGCFAVGGLKST